MRRQLEQGLMQGAAAALLALFAAPLVALVWGTGWQALVDGLRHPLVWPALKLSAMTTSLTLMLVVIAGTPLAWLLSQSRGRTARWVEAAVQLPTVVPPAVAGLALLMAFGRRGLLSALVPEVSFTMAAVVLAELFVAAPYFVQAAIAAFRQVDPELLVVARSFGASPGTLLWRVAVPLSRRGLLAGAVMCWARALGEFGATLMFAGNLEGRTQTVPLAIYTSLESDLRAAQALSLLLVCAAFGVLAILRLLAPRAAEER